MLLCSAAVYFIGDNMQIKFYRNVYPKNRIIRTLNNEVALTGSLRESCSIENPVIKVKHNANIVLSNYAYIPEFGRYYFITDHTIEHGYDIISMHVDVLYTYRDVIKNSQCIARRSTSHYDLYLNDDFIQTCQGYEFNYSKFPYTFDTSNGTWVLMCSGI